MTKRDKLQENPLEEKMIDGKRKMCEQMKRAPVGDRLVSFVSELLSPLLAPYETGCDTLFQGQEGQRVS